MKKQIALVALFFLGMSCFNASAQFGKKIQCRKSSSSRQGCRAGNHLIGCRHRCHEQRIHGMDGQA